MVLDTCKAESCPGKYQRTHVTGTPAKMHRWTTCLAPSVPYEDLRAHGKMGGAQTIEGSSVYRMRTLALLCALTSCWRRRLHWRHHGVTATIVSAIHNLHEGSTIAAPHAILMLAPAAKGGDSRDM